MIRPIQLCRPVGGDWVGRKRRAAIPHKAAPKAGKSFESNQIMVQNEGFEEKQMDLFDYFGLPSYSGLDSQRKAKRHQRRFNIPLTIH